jgi:transcription initiation factor TFIIIB Brf1 subunit/transcription initiation factor TFIIB
MQSNNSCEHERRVFDAAESTEICIQCGLVLDFGISAQAEIAPPPPRNVIKMYPAVREFGANGHFPSCVTMAANNAYKKLKEEYRETDGVSLLISAFYQACEETREEEKMGRTYEEIAATAGVHYAETKRSRQIDGKKKKNTLSPSPICLLERRACALKLSYSDVQIIAESISNLSAWAESFSPKTVAAAAVYKFARSTKKKLTLIAIAREFSVSTSCIRKLNNKLCGIYCIHLFRKLDRKSGLATVFGFGLVFNCGHRHHRR